MKNLIFAITCLGFIGCSSSFPLETVEFVDLERYEGRWYEIASIPIRAQAGCKCTFAEYTLNKEKAYVEVYNQCHTEDGDIKSIDGKAFPVDDTGNSELKVQFFWPFRADYQIIELDDDYQYALVGSPSRKYLWVLSRQNEMDDSLYKDLLERASQKDFDVSLLKRTVHDCP